MFVEEELIEIEIFYKKKGKHYIVYSEEKFKEIDLSEEIKKEYKKLTIQARPLTWGLYNELQESAHVTDELGNRRWNYKAYKESKLKNVIASWDAKIKNTQGEEIAAPVNAKTISKIAPEIAEEIINVYDQKTLIDEEDEKKS